jgi:hypothetical protein
MGDGWGGTTAAGVMTLALAWRNQSDDALAGTPHAYRCARVSRRRLFEGNNGAYYL